VAPLSKRQTNFVSRRPNVLCLYSPTNGRPGPCLADLYVPTMTMTWCHDGLSGKGKRKPDSTMQHCYTPYIPVSRVNCFPSVRIHIYFFPKRDWILSLPSPFHLATFPLPRAACSVMVMLVLLKKFAKFYARLNSLRGTCRVTTPENFINLHQTILS